MSNIRENVRKNIGYFLSVRGMSQKELAQRLKVSQPAVTNWIKGYNSPDIETVSSICAILGVSVEDLFGIEDKPQYTHEEEKIIAMYRTKPELQTAVKILLGIETE